MFLQGQKMSHCCKFTQTFELLKYILIVGSRAKRKSSGLTTKMEEGSLLSIKLNGTAGKIFQARESIWRNSSLIRSSNDKSVTQCSTVQLPGLVTQTNGNPIRLEVVANVTVERNCVITGLSICDYFIFF